MESSITQNQVKNAIRVVWIGLITVVLTVVVYSALAYITGAWQLYVFAGLLSLQMLINVVALYWCRNGRSVAAISLALVGTQLLILATSLLFSGFGVGLGLLTVLLVWQVATLTLSPSGASRAVIISVIVGIITILADMFGSSNRLDVPQLQTTFVIFSFAILIAFSYLVFRGFRNYSVRVKLASAALIITVLIVSILTFFTGQTIRSTLVNGLGANLKTIADARALAVSELLGRQVNMLQTLALNDTLRTAVAAQNSQWTDHSSTLQTDLLAIDDQWQSAPEDAELIISLLNNPAAAVLQEFSALFNVHTELFITDQYGGLVAATNRTTDYYQADEAWWQEAYHNSQGKIYLAPPVYDQSSDDVGMIIALPIFDPGTGQLTGILRSLYTLTDLNELLAETQQLGQTGSVSLIFGDQELILSDDLPKLQDIRHNLPAFDSLQTSISPFEREMYSRWTAFLSLSPLTTLNHEGVIDTLGWSILAQQSEQEALFSLTIQQRLNTLLGIILALGGGALAAYAGGLLAGPITRLTEVAMRISQGDLSAKAEVETADEIGTLAQTFNSMTAQLQASLQNLEYRVAERTRAVEVGAQVGRRLSTILDQDTLVNAVVEQVQKAFNYYHVHIYLLDEAQNRLVLAGGTGKPGEAMMQHGHFVKLGDGLVGRAAETGTVILAPDVSREPSWLANKWLPETRAEVAVPIATEEKVLGVLDVQRTTVGSLTQADANVLQLVANQVAIALQNAHLYALTQQRAERQVVINAIGQKIQSTYTIEEAMQVAVRELGRALEATYTRVHLDLDSLPDEGQTNGVAETPRTKTNS